VEIMANNQAGGLLRDLRRVVQEGTGGGLSDAELLRRFTATRDEAAFEVLVWRYGPLVLGLCRRVLRHEQDAEDAFQAVFLVLARKAGTIGKHASVGSWLHSVAYRIALRARVRESRRRERERRGTEPGCDRLAVAHTALGDLSSALDEEVSRLPRRYREPFVLRYLGGLSNEETARRLTCPEGTVSSRLARARQRLRDRLARRGFAPAAAAGALEASEAAVAVPDPLVRSTLGGLRPSGAISSHVLELTEGMVRTMRMKKVAAAVALVALALGGVGAYRLLAAETEEKGPIVRPRGAGDDGWRLRATHPGKAKGRTGVVALSADGKLLAVAGADRTVRAWDIATGKELGTYLKGHPDLIRALAFAPDGKLLAAGSGFQALVWDVKGGELRKVVRTWYSGTSHVDSELTEVVTALAFAPDGKTLAVCNGARNWACFADLTGKSTVLKGPVPSRELYEAYIQGALGPVNVAFRPDGKELAVASYIAPVNRGRGGISPLVVMDLTIAHPNTTLMPDHEAGINCVAYSPDGKLLAAGTPDKEVLLYAPAGAKVTRTLRGHFGAVRVVAFAPDGKLLASAGNDKAVFLWDVKAGKALPALRGHTRPVCALRFTADGVLVSADDAGVVKVWEKRKP
jgi:RNA polymerase sigma factor (sigma-70 family)